MNLDNRIKGEHLAFKHAAHLAKHYRRENKTLEVLVAVESAIIIGMAIWKKKR